MYHSTPSSAYPSTSISGIHGQLLEVTVVGCNKLKDTEWISRQDPYVCLEYGSTKVRTRTCTDGGKNPTFQEKFTFSMIEGLRELNLAVWNSNTINYDDFIGSGKAQLQKVVSEGYDDSAWPLQTKTGRHAGEVKLILHFAKANKPVAGYAPSAPPYAAPIAPQVSLYSTPPPVSAAPYQQAATAAPYQQAATAAPYQQAAPAAHYQQAATAYPAPSPYASYMSNSAAYPPSPYPPQTAAYPPPYAQPSAYPPSPYPPPPQPHASSHYNPGPYPGVYPPPPY